MKLPKKVQKAIKKIVLDDYDHQGTVSDVDSFLTYDHYGDECIAVQLVVEPEASPQKVAKVMFHIQTPIIRYLSNSKIDLCPFIEVRGFKA